MATSAKLKLHTIYFNKMKLKIQTVLHLNTVMF